METDDNSEVEILYKYKPINKYTLSSLINNEFYFAFPNEFNDPYDSELYSYREGTPEQWDKYLKNINIEPEIKEKYQKLIHFMNYDNELINSSLISGNAGSGERYKKSIMVNCFAKNYNKILMWSHYAEHHKGICIGYKTKIIRDGMFFEMEEKMLERESDEQYTVPIIKIIYSEEYPQAYNPLDPEDYKKDFFRFIKTKYIDWKYENEYRSFIFCKDYNKQLFKFKKEILSEIIFGEFTSNEDIKLIKNIVDMNYINKGIPVTYHKASIIRGKYQLDVKPFDFQNLN
ncbi:MAG: DUF2971 domain-containing protein [Ignavibacteria bacterium]|nr:DUF2971 domain-containing protein [Ignavibacteria bacterium]